MKRHNQYHSRSYGRKQAVISVSPTTPARLACLVIAIFFLYFSFFRESERQPVLDFLPSRSKDPSEDHRLAIIIPFIGQGQDSIPSYLELFCQTAAGSAGLVDFLIFHDGIFGPSTQMEGRFSCPENVIFHSLESIEEFSRTLIRVMDRKPEEQLETGGSRETLAEIVTTFIRSHPYVLVEFKPAFGHIFEQYLEGYSHWGYADLDMLIGDLERWITPDELEDFDIVTYGFGDQNRLYLRGQFTFHKNDKETINQLWRGCDYLSHMDTRFSNVISKKKKLRLESAEGCYSAAVLQHDDIKIKYAVKAFTDVEEKHEKGARDTSHTHGVYVGTGKSKDKTVIYKASMDHRKGLLTLPHDWFERRDNLYANPRELLYKPVGEKQLLENKESSEKCMYWVQDKYQSSLCIDGADSTDTLYWMNGQLYKEKYELAKMPGNVVTAPFFHFQEWKRYYRSAQLGGFRRDGPYSGFVLVKDGVLPIYSDEYNSYRKRRKIEKDQIASPLGRTLAMWNDAVGDGRAQLPSRLYCLQSVPKESPPTTKCNFITSWQDTKHVEILSGAPDWSSVNIESEVTIALTLQLHAEELDGDTNVLAGFFQILALYINHWQGRPVVIVIHVAGATPSVMSEIREKLGSSSDLSDFGMGSVLVAAIFSEKPDTFSRKALMNMALDAAPTRFVLSGYELERGIVPSLDTVYLAHRAAQIHSDSPGAVLAIPQFGLMKGEYDYTVDGLQKARKDKNLDSISKVDELECESDDTTLDKDATTSFGMIEELWWKLTESKANQKDLYGIPVDVHALRLELIQSGVATLLSEKEQYDLYAANASPILLFDNRGPRAGMITSDMVREVDEFGGKMCYNNLRFAQMAALGYRIEVLAGAFAISTPALRESIGDSSVGPLGVSRCDGCFFFTKEEKHEDILEEIALEERQRPAKISLLQ